MKIALNLSCEENYTRFIVYCIENGVDVSDCICPKDCRTEKAFFISWFAMSAHACDTTTLIEDGFIICHPFFSTDKNGAYSLEALINYEYIQNW